MRYFILILGMIAMMSAPVLAQDDDDNKESALAKGGDIPIGTFKLGVMVGLNAAQVDGDALAGYNKLALLAGLEVSYRTSERWMPSLGINYSQKGSRSETVPSGLFYETHYQLDYIEVPVLMNYVDGGIRISGGLAYGRLIGVDIMIDDIIETEDRAPYYRENDFGVVLGFGYYIDKHWGFDLRWQQSFISIVDLDVGNVINQPQINKFLSFRAIYQF